MRDSADTGISSRLLDWYDRHARDLPWRIPPRSGAQPDPYRIWLSEVMLQQTTVAAVKDYFHRFTTRWPDVQALAAADDGDVMAAWAGLGYYARARNLLKCARVVAGQGGFPDTRAGLQELPGIGPYTSAAIAAIAFDRVETVVDGNVERVMARLFDEHTPLPAAKPVLTALAAGLTPAHRPGDYAQAVMDLGATICTPRNPACGICPLMKDCSARAAGTAAMLPLKTRKAAKPVRLGLAYVGRRVDGAWLMERRPGHGLLGGMLGWPGSAWGDTPPTDAAPVPADWSPVTAEVRHTFTHFHLRLSLRVAHLPIDAPGLFVAAQDFTPTALPTVMRKAHALALPYFTQTEAP
ncbi:A/G-specific adenine glycosylase [Roseinatronobacter alkalisoli]|uniref:Adenine DNA glycosylase n=1 Tax=Roseinatronobacter alkalisoli TaxID=3028235 RepID=A0ABT5TDI8_9RHOB|nr:A/G-specific adenine glycosylase [Roseinatronobacter sp. HJB301]MDD7972436.1 A/G-specific adenine glycosylase [Roseinatronobacter sp. HJB301]